MEIVHHFLDTLLDREGLVEYFLQIFFQTSSSFLGFEVEDHGLFGAGWG